MALIVSGNDQFIRNMIDERDNALAEIARLKRLIKDINHAHFQNGAWLDYEEWMKLLASTRADMEAISAEMENENAHR